MNRRSQPSICTAERERSRLVFRSWWWLAAAMTMFTGPGWAATCNVGATGVSFGSYNPFNNNATDSAGTITVQCDVAAPYSIALSPGGGTFFSRAMTGGGHVLNYNLYSDATRTSIWGDGTASTVTVPGTGTTVNHTVYGRIPARQNAYVGSYNDSIVVTLTF